MSEPQLSMAMAMRIAAARVGVQHCIETWENALRDGTPRRADAMHAELDEACSASGAYAHIEPEGVYLEFGETTDLFTHSETLRAHLRGIWEERGNTGDFSEEDVDDELEALDDSEYHERFEEN
jgi:hypothetical protein